MSFIVAQDLAVVSAQGFQIPKFTTATRPANPEQGQVIYNTTTQLFEIFHGGQWRRSDQFSNTTGFLYRQIITTGYVMGGYRSAQPWRNVNRMNHTTDVMTNLGDLLSAAGAYTSGANSLTRGFLWSADNNFPGTSAQTVAFNLATETGAGLNSSWNMTVGRGDNGTGFKENLFAYITGGSTTSIDQFNLTTETMISLGLTSSTPGSSGTDYGTSAISDESFCFFWGGGNTRLTFATNTYQNLGTPDSTNITVRGSSIAGSDGQQKGICSKLGRGYMGNEGTYNGGYNLRRWICATETYTTVAKPIGNTGEENFDMGQEKQYMMGCYDGDQNNRGWKFTYATDSGFELGAGSVRTGVPGGSSGHCVWK
ncbi:MAG: hypothetical protein EBU90_12750 [Proteobacteria bacterium]|nr:hypothetical protein [Pseudomonadota bacterium]NBP14866.1 hypothetical protein [bacterium]